ncbi:SRPBCC domain-containing protein [Aestuariimicrobium ganziense]|uniref:SRPBCC domain-containing protein n=1 Tax=Aestuariimicrobium ganziense TaxID=2773677 RepID=UPI001941F3A3|nr:SRPBCC domain-containing protein [Aestuariimicrobium ganziense]
MPRHDAVFADEPARVRFVRLLPLNPDRLWWFVGDPEGLQEWFPAPVVSYESRAGGRICLSGDPYKPDGSSGRVLVFEQGQRFAFEWGEDELELSVSQTSMGLAQLELVNRLSDRDGAARNAAGWDLCLDALESAATGFWVAEDDHTGAFGALVGHYRDQGFPDDGWRPVAPADPN